MPDFGQQRGIHFGFDPAYLDLSERRTRQRASEVPFDGDSVGIPGYQTYVVV